MNEAIVIDDLEVTRGLRRVLRGAGISLKKGPIAGLLGPSGSRKSTFIRSIADVQEVRLGMITVPGRLAESFAARASLDYMTQASAAYKDLTVHENITHWARIARAPASTADEMVSQLRLTNHTHALAADISDGQASQLPLACMMAGGPPVLFLNGPAVGLDPALHEEVWDLIREHAAAGTTVLVSSHATDEAQRCGSLVFICEGSVLTTGMANDILEETATSSMDAAFLALTKEQAE